MRPVADPLARASPSTRGIPNPDPRLRVAAPARAPADLSRRAPRAGSLAAGWPWLFEWVLPYLLVAAGLAALLACSLAGRPRAGRPALLAAFSVVIASQAVAAGGYWARSAGRDAAVNALELVPNAAFAAGLARFEPRFLRVLLVYGALQARDAEDACDGEADGGMGADNERRER